MGEKRPNPNAAEQYKEDEPRKLFAGGLARRTNAESLKAYFSGYGSVVDTIVMMDPQGESRGFGFVTFDRTESVDAVIQQPVHFVDGKQIDIKRSVAKHLRPPPRQYDRSKKAFLGGLPADMSEEELKQFFSIYGKVSDVTIMYDEKTLKSRGFGFIGFDDETVIDKLLKQQYIQIRNKQVEVKAARPRTAIGAYNPMADAASMLIGPTMPQQSVGPGFNGPYPYAQQLPQYPQQASVGQYYDPTGAYGASAGGYGAPGAAAAFGNYYGGMGAYGANMYGYGGVPSTPGAHPAPGAPTDPPSKRMKGPAAGAMPPPYPSPYGAGAAPNAGAYPYGAGTATSTPSGGGAADPSAAYASYYAAAAAAYQQQQQPQYPTASGAAPGASASATPGQQWWPQYPSYSNGTS